MRGSVSIGCAALAAALVVGPGAGAAQVAGGQPVDSRAGERAPERSGAGTLWIDTRPAEAHVYLKAADGQRSLGPCTSSCNLRVDPGAYRLEAGFEHRHLAPARDQLVLAPGERRAVTVTVEKDTLRTSLVVGGLACGLVSTVALGTVTTARDGLDWWRSSPNALQWGLVGGMAASLIFAGAVAVRLLRVVGKR